MEKIYSKLGFPDSTKIYKEIDSGKFLSSSYIDKDYKEIFSKYVEKVTWIFSLKGNILNIQACKSEYMQYSEIEILQVEINNNLAIYDVATVIGRTIQYPVILFFVKGNKFKIGIYKIRENKNDFSRNVVQDIVFTGWFDKNNLYGRIIDIIKEINYGSIAKDNLYSTYNDYYEKIYNFHSSYIKIEILVKILKHLDVINSKNIEKQILLNCENVPIDENELNKNDWYKKDKNDKYNLETFKSIMVCKDQVMQFVYEHGNRKFKSFNELEKIIKFVEEKEYFNNKISEKKNKRICAFYDGKMCINSSCYVYGKECIDSDNCKYFKRQNLDKNIKYYRPNVNNVTIDIESNIANSQNDIVEYGDSVEVLEIDNNKLKTFVIYKLNDGLIPPIPNKCLGNRVGYEFSFKFKNYKIINIIKNNN